MIDKLSHIINEIELNIIVIMASAVAGVIVSELWLWIKKTYAEIQPIQKLSKIKLIKILIFTLRYAFPLGTILLLIIDQRTKPTLLNITFTIFVFVFTACNILMFHINTIYQMIKELAKTSSDNLGEINDNFGSVVKTFDKLKKENNLK